jgi:hypothetical protein
MHDAKTINDVSTKVESSMTSTQPVVTKHKADPGITICIDIILFVLRSIIDSKIGSNLKHNKKSSRTAVPVPPPIFTLRFQLQASNIHRHHCPKHFITEDVILDKRNFMPAEPPGKYETT